MLWSCDGGCGPVIDRWAPKGHGAAKRVSVRATPAPTLCARAAPPQPTTPTPGAAPPGGPPAGPAAGSPGRPDGGAGPGPGRRARGGVGARDAAGRGGDGGRPGSAPSRDPGRRTWLLGRARGRARARARRRAPARGPCAAGAGRGAHPASGGGGVTCAARRRDVSGGPAPAARLRAFSRLRLPPPPPPRGGPRARGDGVRVRVRVHEPAVGVGAQGPWGPRRLTLGKCGVRLGEWPTGARVRLERSPGRMCALGEGRGVHVCAWKGPRGRTLGGGWRCTRALGEGSRARACTWRGPGTTGREERGRVAVCMWSGYPCALGRSKAVSVHLEECTRRGGRGVRVHIAVYVDLSRKGGWACARVCSRAGERLGLHMGVFAGASVFACSRQAHPCPASSWSRPRTESSSLGGPGAP